MKLKKDNVLIIADTHLPFEHPLYLDFCKEIQERCKCGTVVHIGDLVGNHSISFHEHDPNGKSPSDEMEETDEHLQRWFKAFPKLHICKGNHDALVERKSRHVGLPKRVYQSFRNIWKLPKGWKDVFGVTIDNVRYEHGTGRSGKTPHVQAAYDNRKSTVIGHCHSVSGIEYSANSENCIFGMSVGCGIHRKSYAFRYGKDFKRKPILSCGIVTDRGRYAQVFPMDL